MNPERDLIRQAARAVAGSKVRIIDLAQPWKIGMPHWPTHPPFLFTLSMEKGIYIMEALNLEPLHLAGVHEFLFISSPLKIVGGTGSPIRPFALA